jgi:hypothetical protein
MRDGTGTAHQQLEEAERHYKEVQGQARLARTAASKVRMSGAFERSLGVVVALRTRSEPVGEWY